MISYDYTEFFEVLRELVRDAYDIPTTSPIIESGNELIEVNEKTYPLPWGVIELEGDIQHARGPAAMDISSFFNIYLWVYRKRPEGQFDLDTERRLISIMADTVWGDPHLMKTVSNTEPLGGSWTGSNREWPVRNTEGSVLSAAYVGFRFQLTESRVTS